MNRILVFTSTFPRFTNWDGTPPFVYELSRRLVQEWNEIIILTPRVPGTLKYEIRDWMQIHRYSYFFSENLEKLNDGAILPNLKKNKWLYFQIPFFLFFGLYNLIRIVKIQKINTVHAHWIIPQWLLAVIAKKIFFPKLKIIVTSHGWDIFWLRWRLSTYCKKIVLKNIDILTIVSHSIQQEVVKLGAPPELETIIAPMWVDDNQFHPDEYDQIIKSIYNIQGKFLLFVWRLAEKKWVGYLLDAMYPLIQRYPDIKLLIIWHGPLEQELRDQAKFLKIDTNVVFVWSVPNTELPKFYATADIFIWPSIEAQDWDSEWFWLVFVEAILSGCITLWSHIHWISDIIEDGRTGFFIKDRDPIDIEQKIIQCIEHNDFDTKKAREIIKNKFSWNIISKKYIEILNK